MIAALVLTAIVVLAVLAPRLGADTLTSSVTREL